MLQSVSQNVVLETFGTGMSEDGGYYYGFGRNLPNGEQDCGPEGTGWSVPAGQALVVTDVDWQYVDPQGAESAGIIQTLRLFNGENRVFESTITLSTLGQGGACESMTTGFVILPGAWIHLDVIPGPTNDPSGLQHMILRGYLIPDKDDEKTIPDKGDIDKDGIKVIPDRGDVKPSPR